MPTTTKRVTTPPPVPNLHFVLIVAAGAIMLLSGVAFYFAPADKAKVFEILLYSTGTFLFGKFSNSFGKTLQAFPTSIPAMQIEEETTTTGTASAVEKAPDA